MYPPSSFYQSSQTFFSGGVFGGQGFGVGSFGSCTGNIACAANTILYIINGILVPVLFAVAFIVFLYGIARSYIFSRGDVEEVKKGHTLILWGLIAFAVMISVWGLVNVVANTFGLGGYYAPQTPVSYPTSVSTYGGQQSQQTQYVECPKDANGNCL